MIEWNWIFKEIWDYRSIQLIGYLTNSQNHNTQEASLFSVDQLQLMYYNL